MNLAPNFEARRDDFDVLVQCIEDILHAKQYLHVQCLIEYAEADEEGILDGDDNAFFSIETNPAHDLEVSIDISSRSCTIRVNGISFTERPGLFDEFTEWVAAQCTRVEALLQPSLELKRNSFAGITTSATLRVPISGKKTDIGSRSNGVLGALLWLIPFGIGLVLTHEKSIEFKEWYGPLPDPHPADETDTDDPDGLMPDEDAAS